VAWFDAALGAGVDPNMTVPSADYVQEAVLTEAMRAETSRQPKLCCAGAQALMRIKTCS